MAPVATRDAMNPTPIAHDPPISVTRSILSPVCQTTLVSRFAIPSFTIFAM